MPPYPGPHAHGAPEEEEEVVVVRTDGPPFADIMAKQGEGFEVDYEKVSRHLGAGKISLMDFSRDMDAVNRAYIPTAHRSHVYLRNATVLLLGSFIAFIIMGIIGGTPEIRSVILPIICVVFFAGVFTLYYSKWIEQPGVKAGAVLVKKLLDEQINPGYADSTYRIRWTVRVNVAKASTMHMGTTFVERPIISIYALRSEGDNGMLLDWPLPEVFMQGLLFERKKKVLIDDGSDAGW